jgi:hypothetical protein
MDKLSAALGSGTPDPAADDVSSPRATRSQRAVTTNFVLAGARIDAPDTGRRGGHAEGRAPAGHGVLAPQDGKQ